MSAMLEDERKLSRQVRGMKTASEDSVALETTQENA